MLFPPETLFLGLLFHWPLLPVACVDPVQAPTFIHHPSSIIGSSEEWNFTQTPSPSTTPNLIFNTLSSLLQHWPNTRYRNGHTIISGTIPPGTLLYHGTSTPQIPKTPEWTATDPEHSYIFCAPASSGGCWHLTLVTTRPLKVLYFDGSSAAKIRGGTMDSQDLLLFGEVRPSWGRCERERIAELCKWGGGYGVDGFVRMQMDFEVMLCNFTSEGVKTVSFLNLALSDKVQYPKPPGYPPTPSASTSSHPDPKPHTIPPPLHVSPLFRVLESSNWHNTPLAGDPRIHLDYTRFISFYDAEMFPSLLESRLGKGRLAHRLDEISVEDVERFRRVLGDELGSWSRESGVDWSAVMKVVRNRYEERLEMLLYILSSQSESSDTLKKAHNQITSMLVPYILHSSSPPSSSSSSFAPEPWPSDHTWAIPIFQLCATTHTLYMKDSLHSLTRSERTLLYAIKGVSKEICRVLVGMWAEGVEGGVNRQLDESGLRTNDILNQWRSKVATLMEWLDWSGWNRCMPACSYEEMCYLPTWPFFFPPEQWSSFESKSSIVSESRNRTDISDDDDDDDDDESGDSEWADPKPRCIRRVEPLQWEAW